MSIDNQEGNFVPNPGQGQLFGGDKDVRVPHSGEKVVTEFDNTTLADAHAQGLVETPQDPSTLPELMPSVTTDKKGFLRTKTGKFVASGAGILALAGAGLGIGLSSKSGGEHTTSRPPAATAAPAPTGTVPETSPPTTRAEAQPKYVTSGEVTLSNVREVTQQLINNWAEWVKTGDNRFLSAFLSNPDATGWDNLMHDYQGPDSYGEFLRNAEKYDQFDKPFSITVDSLSNFDPSTQEVTAVLIMHTLDQNKMYGDQPWIQDISMTINFRFKQVSITANNETVTATLIGQMTQTDQHIISEYSPIDPQAEANRQSN